MLEETNPKILGELFDDPILLKDLEDTKMQECLNEINDYFESKDYNGVFIKNIPELRYNDSDKFEFQAYMHDYMFFVDVYLCGKDKNNYEISSCTFEFDIEENDSKIKEHKKDVLYSAFWMMLEEVRWLQSNETESNEPL